MITSTVGGRPLGLLATLAATLLVASRSTLGQLSVEVDKEGVAIPCIDNGKYYRNPTVSNTRQDCGKYYQCYDNKVIMFRCNSDLYFDIDRQICDFKLKVSNCDKSHGEYSLPVLDYDIHHSSSSSSSFELTNWLNINRWLNAKTAASHRGAHLPERPAGLRRPEVPQQGTLLRRPSGLSGPLG